MENEFEKKGIRPYVPGIEAGFWRVYVSTFIDELNLWIKLFESCKTDDERLAVRYEIKYCCDRIIALSEHL